MMLVLTSMLATVIEATAKMGHNNRPGMAAKCKLVPLTIASKAGTNGDTKYQASMLNQYALKAINSIVKELPEDHSTSFQGTR